MTLNKRQEIAVLDSTIDLLGENSYLGPWLKSIRFEIERDLNSDIIPYLSIADARRQADAIISAANDKAASAVIEAEAVVKQSQKQADAIIARVKQVLLTTASTL